MFWFVANCSCCQVPLDSGGRLAVVRRGGVVGRGEGAAALYSGKENPLRYERGLQQRHCWPPLYWRALYRVPHQSPLQLPTRLLPFRCAALLHRLQRGGDGEKVKHIILLHSKFHHPNHLLQVCATGGGGGGVQGRRPARHLLRAAGRPPVRTGRGSPGGRAGGAHTAAPGPALLIGSLPSNTLHHGHCSGVTNNITCFPTYIVFCSRQCISRKNISKPAFQLE